MPLIQGSKGNTIVTKFKPRSKQHKAAAMVLLSPENSLQADFRQRTPTDLGSGNDGGNSDLRLQPEKMGPQVFPKMEGSRVFFEEELDEQPLPVPQRSKIQEMSFEEMVAEGSNASIYWTEYAPSTDSVDNLKSPFLKRMSRVMLQRLEKKFPLHLGFQE